jgi:hypothetical protein
MSLYLAQSAPTDSIPIQRTIESVDDIQTKPIEVESIQSSSHSYWGVGVVLCLIIVIVGAVLLFTNRGK